jgi:hypothetical protein
MVQETGFSWAMPIYYPIVKPKKYLINNGKSNCNR